MYIFAIVLYGGFMDSTGTAEFRTRMKEWFDTAEQGPVKVNRPTGKSVIILGIEQYEAMIKELHEYRQVVSGLVAVAEGKVKQYSTNEMEDLSQKSLQRLKAKHKKKATG